MISAEDLGKEIEPSEEVAEQARALLEASNNWVVSGEKAASGDPLPANDPHLGFQVPSLWHLAHLEAPGSNSIGATLTGLPAVVIGRSEDIAWGATSVGADVQDLYVMDESEDGEGHIHDGGTKEYEVRTETIEVADGEAVEIREGGRGTPYRPASMVCSTCGPKAITSDADFGLRGRGGPHVESGWVACSGPEARMALANAS